MNKNIIRMNKKGNLLAKETLKIVLAVISISFLVFFLVSLYYSYSRNKDLELAEASLKHLIKEINSGSPEVEIYNPKGWGITSYGEGERIPDFCLNLGWKNCVCICGPLKGSIKTAKTACLTVDEKGRVCKESGYSVFAGGINIEPPLILTINYTDKTISKKQT